MATKPAQQDSYFENYRKNSFFINSYALNNIACIQKNEDEGTTNKTIPYFDSFANPILFEF